MRFRKDFTIAVIEAKSAYKNAADGLQQAKEYAKILGLKIAYATNGKGIVEHNFIIGKEPIWRDFPPRRNYGQDSANPKASHRN